jgi:hypothetical protein
VAEERSKRVAVMAFICYHGELNPMIRPVSGRSESVCTGNIASGAQQLAYQRGAATVVNIRARPEALGSSAARRGAAGRQRSSSVPPVV